MYFFLILLIDFFLKLTISELINNNRIEGALKYAISSLEDIPNIPIKNDTIIFNYEKYKIICNNFRLISPDLKNTSIINTTLNGNSSIYYFENIKFVFYFDLKIAHNSFTIKENDNYLEINCTKIKYNLIGDFLFFNSLEFSDVINYSIITDMGMDILDYYKDAKEKKKCLCKFESEFDYVEEFPEVYMIRFLKYLIMYYISEIEINDIILTYDAKMIFSNTLTLIDNLNINGLEYIKINKILIPFDKIETLKNNNNERKLIIHQIKFFGVFNLTEFNEEFEFIFELDEENNKGIELFNRNINFNFNDIIIGTHFESSNKPEILEILKSAIINSYSKVLIDSNKKYYI